MRERNGEVWATTAPVAPDDEADLAAALARAADAALADAAAAFHWEADDPEATVDRVAAAAGLPGRRAVLQLRRPLPLEPEVVAATRPVAVRPLRPGTADEEAWVRCNNRAFAGHPDQGRESVATLHAAMRAPWFDAAGFLLADGDPPVDAGGDLDGFCWTKVHPAGGGEPERGEIYVIGIDPGAGGRGLGRSLTVAGLSHMADRGLGLALLYVDAGNAPARRLYDALGFGLHATRWVRSRVAPGSGQRSTT